MAQFKQAIPRILVWEGTYVNDPDDLGGETNHGITDKLDGTVDGWVDIDGDGKPDVRIKELTKEQAIEIYKRRFWDVIKGDQINSQAIATIIFDGYVNMGVPAIRMIQRLAFVKTDGRIGPQTLAAINTADEKSLYNNYKLERIAYYKRIADRRPQNRKFLKGWLRRINSFPDL
jgi:lysozyme family protein